LTLSWSALSSAMASNGSPHGSVRADGTRATQSLAAGTLQDDGRPA